MTVALGAAMALWLTEFRAVRIGAAAAVILLARTFAPGALLALSGGAIRAIAVPIRRRRRQAERDLADLASVCELLTIALTGGFGLHAALQLACKHVPGAVGSEIEALLRRGRVDGLSEVLADAGGRGSRLYRIIGHAAATGSPLLEPIAGLARDLESETAARRLEATRRTPVALLIPLTVLVLPGFLLLSIAPALLDAFGRLDL